MADSSSRLYRQRKLRRLIPGLSPRPTFQLNALPYHFRPHVTLPELVEETEGVWLPPPPTPPTPPEVICQFDTGAQFDTGGQYDTPCEGPVPPAPTIMVWDSGIAWDSGWVWL